MLPKLEYMTVAEVYDSTETYAEISAKHGLSKMQISNIKLKKTYKGFTDFLDEEKKHPNEGYEEKKQRIKNKLKMKMDELKIQKQKVILDEPDGLDDLEDSDELDELDELDEEEDKKPHWEVFRVLDEESGKILTVTVWVDEMSDVWKDERGNALDDETVDRLKASRKRS